MKDHLIAASSELWNPGPSGHQPLPGSFHKKKSAEQGTLLFKLLKASCPLEIPFWFCILEHCTQMLPLLHVSPTYQVSKSPGVCHLRSHILPGIVPLNKKIRSSSWLAQISFGKGLECLKNAYVEETYPSIGYLKTSSLERNQA